MPPNAHRNWSITLSVEDALIDYFNNPARFNPQRAGLFTYLHWRARSRLLNLMAGQKKIFEREKVVEVEDGEAVYQVVGSETADIERSLVQHEMDKATWRKICEIFTDPVDLELVKLMMDGVRETARYAELLGCSSLSADEQASLVKRHKDRLKKSIQRKYSREEIHDARRNS